MQDFRVNLIKKARDTLSKVEVALKMDPDQAFEFVVRNMLRFYYITENEGYFWLVYSSGKSRKMQVMPHLGHRSISRPGELFHAAVNPQPEDVSLQASIYGLSETDLINRLVIIGGELALHLKDGAAFGFTKSGDPLGRIDFV